MKAMGVTALLVGAAGLYAHFLFIPAWVRAPAPGGPAHESIQEARKIEQARAAIPQDKLLTNDLALDLSSQYGIAIFDPRIKPGPFPILLPEQQDAANRIRLLEKQVEALQRQIKSLDDCRNPTSKTASDWLIALGMWFMGVVATCALNHVVKRWMDQLLPAKGN